MHIFKADNYLLLAFPFVPFLLLFVWLGFCGILNFYLRKACTKPLPLSWQAVDKGVHTSAALLLLGGDAQREELTAELAAGRPNLVSWLHSDFRRLLATAPLYISSAHGNVYDAMVANGVSQQRLHVDETATDTVTNFTTTLPVLLTKGITHLLIITSDYHAVRSYLAGRTVLPRRITTILLPLPSRNCKQHNSIGIAIRRALEWGVKGPRDLLRALLWRGTGKEGSSLLGETLHPERFQHLRHGKHRRYQL